MKVPFEERGQRTTAEVLPDLVAGKPATVDGVEFALAPGAEMPPVIVASGRGRVRRVARFGDEWFPAFSSPSWLAEQGERLAADAGVGRIAAMPFTSNSLARGEQIELLGEVAGLLR